MISYLFSHAGTIFMHTALGGLFAATGFSVRSACSHRGWLPHPKHQIALTGALVFVEACVTVPVVG